MREQPTIQRLFATPHYVGDEVLKTELLEPRRDAGVMRRVVTGEDQELLHRSARCVVKQLADLVGSL